MVNEKQGEVAGQQVERKEEATQEKENNHTTRPTSTPRSDGVVGYIRESRNDSSISITS